MRLAGEKNEDIGASRGGKTSKIHALCNRSGKPLKLILTSGERNDCTQAGNLLEGAKAACIIADKGYDAGEIVKKIEGLGAEAVIPPRKNWKKPRVCGQKI